MTMNQLRLRPVDELRAEAFYIPAYQRGYRWTETQVIELLEDVWDFVRIGRKAKGEFYCLQPVVVAPLDGGKWEVVDGQQRLTTLFLVLSFFNERFTEPYRKSLFSIEYHTRKDSAAFLRSVQPERSKENIDFSHMVAAANAIREWFLDKTASVNDIESAFLQDVRVIWYELEPGSRPLEVFQRLNMGKIALTEGELVKALFLRASNFVGDESRLLQLRQLQIAQEWDAMERRLQEDDFWYFLTNQDRESNRIELLLALCTKRAGNPDKPMDREPGIFHAFSQRLDTPGVQAWEEWKRVKRTFLTLEEWFRNSTLHHLVGFLASRQTDDPMAVIKAVTAMVEEAPSKRAFLRELKREIFARVFRRGQSGGVDLSTMDLPSEIGKAIHGLDYSHDPAAIRNVLLLFNIASLLESNTGARFPFALFKRENWDIEHIRSVQSRMPQRTDDQKRWLETFLGYLGEDADATQGTSGADAQRLDFIGQSRALLDAPRFDGEAFALLFGRIQQAYDPYQDPEADNSIGNLTLLDAGTNRGYGNAIFPIKRKTIIALDRVGQFVPLCTKNVFLKYYSPRVDRMLVWDKVDSHAHAQAICERLVGFFSDKETP